MLIQPLKPGALKSTSLEINLRRYSYEKENIGDSYKLNPVDGLRH